ncbi:MAG: hypothetical protein P4L92_09020 [Rudaea sp.]|nr:hypothetical protein [Rudaea sp.]
MNACVQSENVRRQDTMRSMRDARGQPHGQLDIPSAPTDRWTSLPEGRRREAEWQSGRPAPATARTIGRVRVAALRKEAA